ncbi:MAG: VOC family protein [Bacteroidota bacterium]
MKILGSPTECINSILSELDRLNIDYKSFQLDHICYRVETMERYTLLKHQLRTIAFPFHESLIAGRMISILKFVKPLKWLHGEIEFLELPAPKPNRPYKEGFEHIEFVVDQNLGHFINTYPRIAFNTKGLSKALNADVKIQFEKYAVKFHCLPIDQVIEIENSRNG